MIELKEAINARIPAGRQQARDLLPLMEAETDQLRISFKGMTAVPATFLHELLKTANQALERRSRPDQPVHLEHMPRAPQETDRKIARAAGRSVQRRADVWIIAKSG